MKTKEEIQAMPPYERRAYLLFCNQCEPDDERPPVVISYLTARASNATKITGKVFQEREVHYDHIVNTTWLEETLNEKLFTKAGKVRKKYEEMSAWESYMAGSLLLYLEQARKECHGKVLISYQERKWLEDK